MRLMSGTVDAGVAMSGSSESSNEKWIYSGGPIDALVSSYLEAMQFVTNKCNAGLIRVASGQTDFIASMDSESTFFG